MAALEKLIQLLGHLSHMLEAVAVAVIAEKTPELQVLLMAVAVLVVKVAQT